MNFNDILKKSFLSTWEAQQNIPTGAMIVAFGIISVLSMYIYFVYRQTTKASFYSSNFAKTLVGVPIVTTAIVFAMQVNLLVSLGMVGALSIVRFRTAIKDPLDLLFIFWSISVGIVCGTGSYIISVLLCVIMTVILFFLDFMPSKTNSMLLVVHAERIVISDTILELVNANTRYNKVRTQVIKEKSKEFLIEVKVKNDSKIVELVSEVSGVNKVVLLTHDGEVRL